MIRQTIERIHSKLFSEAVKSRVEALIIVLSLAGFLVHLALILAGLIAYSLINWGMEVYQYNRGVLPELTDINNIFYDEFFTTLILVDVFLLILSFRFTNYYSLLIRNTGYIVSTVLIRLSFTTAGLFNMVLVVGGVLFGTLTLLIYNQIGRLYQGEEGESNHLN